MIRSVARSRAFIATSALCLAGSPYLTAQPTAPAAASSDANDETIVLSPFTVDASSDANGYRANSTLAGTRVRTDLRDVASAISVVTQQFLQDTGATSSADLLVYTPSTEVGGLRGNFSGVAGTSIYQENTVSTTTRVRGLDSADNTRDYFLTDIPWDGFNVGRVDLQRGPNSILFGTGSPAGIINTSVNDAMFKTAYHFENRIDEWGSVRNAIDLNQRLIPGVAAIRVAAVQENLKFEQEPAYRDTTRYYGALRIDPKIFSEANHTSIRAKYEKGKVNSNNPRTIPPGDDYTRWFRTGVDQYGNPGYNKIILNAFNTAQTFNGVAYPGGVGGPLSQGLALANQGRSFWPDIINYYEGTAQNINNVQNPNPPGATPIKTIAAQANTNLALRDANNNILLGQGVNQAFIPRAIPMNTAYVPNAGTRSGFPGGVIPGAVYYSNIVLQDPSIFNFYKKLLDGPNKHEWQRWNAYNLVLDQGFLNDRVAFQIAYDHQNYVNGAEPFMTGENYNINIDINATYADGTPNPNAGRPYAGNGASAPGLNFQNTTDRTVFRFTPTADVRASDFLGDTSLAKIIGKHTFTGLYESNKVVNNYVNYARYATTPDYIIQNRTTDTSVGQLGADRSFEWIYYIGPSLLSNNTKGTGVNLTNVSTMVAPPKTQFATNFNARWNKPIVPTLPGYVDPTAPYSYTDPNTGNVNVRTQADNPANYVGWTQQPITWMRASDPSDFPSLVQSANRTRYRDISKGITWQGYLLGGDLVPTFGWRKDTITSYQTNSKTDPQSGFTSLDFMDDLGSRKDVTGESKSWGVVYHLPKSLTARIPWDTTISLFYDRGKNFKADATRLNLAGVQIPNATGDTREYGVTITTLQDKLSLKVAKFKTKVSNATLADTQGNSIGGLGQNAYFIADGSIWGYGWATYLQDAINNRGGATISTYGDYATNDGFTRNTPAEIAAADNYNVNGGTSPTGITYVGHKTVTNAWVNAPFPATFFSSYNLTPAIDPSIAKRTGNLRDSYIGTFNESNGPVLGGGSSFGNHQTTVDNLSDGTEIELSYQPIKTWNITANYSKVHATHENVDPVSIAFIGAMTKFLNGPGGQIREWFNGGDTLMKQWNNSIVAPYAVTMNELGHEAPEVSPWRLNLVTTYTFDRGATKGLFVGGGWREEAGRIIGYHFDPKIKNSISSDPNFAAVQALTLGGLDVNQPFRGKNESHFDAWVGYSRKFKGKINWRIQLNLQNVGEKDHLVSSKVNPDGGVALARIVEGMGYRLTNSIDF